MIKSELIATMSKQLSNVPEQLLISSINTLLDYMSITLGDKGERIEIRGFGSFSLHYRPPRDARNPKTGHKVRTEAKYKIHYKPGKEMRNRVNEKNDRNKLI